MNKELKTLILKVICNKDLNKHYELIREFYCFNDSNLLNQGLYYLDLLIEYNVILYIDYLTIYGIIKDIQEELRELELRELELRELELELKEEFYI